MVYNKSYVEAMKTSYPIGTRVELICLCNDEQGMPEGLRGTVMGVDDQPALLIKWDNGRSLSLLPKEDTFRKLTGAELAEEANIQSGIIHDKNETADSHKPDCELIGQDGNIFNLMGIASRTLKDHGMAEQAKEMQNRITSSSSYREALAVIGEYVKITGPEEPDEEEEFSMTELE